MNSWWPLSILRGEKCGVFLDMLKVGITGQEGFIGTHLRNTLVLDPGRFQLVAFEFGLFDDSVGLEDFVRQCDSIVHLAARTGTTILWPFTKPMSSWFNV